MSSSNYYHTDVGRSANSPMPQLPPVPSREAATEDLYRRDALIPTAGAASGRLGSVDALLRSTAQQQQQAYPASAAVDPYPYSDAAVRTLLARRLAAAVVADRTERLAHERLMHDLALLQERQRLQRAYGAGQQQEPYPPQVQSEYARDSAGALPFPPAPPAERSYHLPSPPAAPGQPIAADGSDDEAAILKAEAEACMALSLLGGRRMSGVSAVATTAAEEINSEESAVESNKESPAQRIVSPGASPSPPISAQQQQQPLVKERTTKKAAKKMAEKDNTDAAKKRKKTEDAADSGKPKKKKGRKKENGMPRRPLSAYNIFFSEERERILGDVPQNGVDGSQQSTAERAILERRFSNPSSTPSGPAKTMQEQASNKRRKHRKTHGKIGFRDLARTIGQRWKTLPDDRMDRYKRLAKIDMDRYQEELAAYRRGKMIREVAMMEDAKEGAPTPAPLVRA